MTIEDYVRATGLSSGYFADAAGVEHGVIKAIEANRPIARAKAEKICAYLSRELGRPIRIEDIKGLKIC